MEHLEVSSGGERSLSVLAVGLGLHCLEVPIVGEREDQHEGRGCTIIMLVMKCFHSSLPVVVYPSLEGVAMVAEDLMFSLLIWGTCLALKLESTLACGECVNL